MTSESQNKLPARHITQSGAMGQRSRSSKPDSPTRRCTLWWTRYTGCRFESCREAAIRELSVGQRMKIFHPSRIRLALLVSNWKCMRHMLVGIQPQN